VVVKNTLDDNLDWTTLQIENISHSNRIDVKNGNEIVFNFESIYLPDSTTDEPNSHGYIAYKIKPKENISIGNIVQNSADIIFDFNEAIKINKALTEVVDDIIGFLLYPIPTENYIYVSSKAEIASIKISDNIGKLVLQNTNKNQIDVSNLTQGLYFVKIIDINGDIGFKKMIKK